MRSSTRILLVAVVAAELAACRIDFASGAIGESPPAVWDVEGTPRKIERTFFRVCGQVLEYVVEWTCDECKYVTSRDRLRSQELGKAVLREAALRGDTDRLVVRHAVGTFPDRVGRWTSTMRFERGGRQLEESVGVDSLGALWDWTWDLGGSLVRAQGAGYYFELGAKEAWFVTKAVGGCPGAVVLDEATAAVLAEPVMRRLIVSGIPDRLLRQLPAHSIPDGFDRNMVGLSVEVSCRDPSCELRGDCLPGFYRVLRRTEHVPN
jgi:hypothetical protein